MSIQSRLCSALIATLLIAPSVQTSLAQAPTNIVRTVLAVTSLPSVGDVPLFFKLSRVELPPVKQRYIPDRLVSSMLCPARLLCRRMPGSNRCSKMMRSS
jgi:hypothetical protein